MHPTDSSVNVAISQGAHADATGACRSTWRTRPAGFSRCGQGLGFPSGKDKTVRIDLTGVFPPTGPRRLRLATNLEVFWDRLGWAAGRPDVRPRMVLLPLRSADLRYRGYSVTEQPNASTPERPRYTLAGTTPRWPDLRGITRGSATCWRW